MYILLKFACPLLIYAANIEAAFFVCPFSCSAALLPRDMETMQDCICEVDSDAVLHDNNEANSALRRGTSTLFQCPINSQPRVNQPMSFADCECVENTRRDEMFKTCTSQDFHCTGRYKPKENANIVPLSPADCDCESPYTRNEQGLCALTSCPRAGNYYALIPDNVHSLLDCGCLEPFVKNDRSGDCIIAAAYTCPAFSSPTFNLRPQSFADCECNFGYVRTSENTCVREKASYICPTNSSKRREIGFGVLPRGFEDCVCLDPAVYHRNEKTQTCDEIGKNGQVISSQIDNFFCPSYSIPLSPHPQSTSQCECVPGFAWKTPEMICVRLSTYHCPNHSSLSTQVVVVDEKQVEASFSDCECARGYSRDDDAEACRAWYLDKARKDGCPDYSFLKHWPLQSSDNCQCIYGAKSNRDTDKAGKSLAQHRKKPKLLKCERPPAESKFSQCPPQSYANTWPVGSEYDCTCLGGHEATALNIVEETEGNGYGFHCVQKSALGKVEKEQLGPTCIEPLEINPYTGECRLRNEEVFPSDSSKIGQIIFKGIEYDYVLADENIMVIQGDIAIGQLLEWDEHPGGPENEKRETKQQKRKRGRTRIPVLHGYYNAERDHRWPGSRMCYEISAPAKNMEETVKMALKQISDLTHFNFHRCRQDNCKFDINCPADFVKVNLTSSSCYSYIGRIGGVQPVGISSDCGVGNLIHTFLHTLGLHHTIDRLDRDDHIRIAWECISPEKRSYFVVEDTNASLSLIEPGITDTLRTQIPYDFYSIMHHSPTAFLRDFEQKSEEDNNDIPNWCRSLFPIISDIDDRLEVMGGMGQRDHMTITDIHAVWRIYPSLQEKESPTYDQLKVIGVHASRLHTVKDVTGENSNIEDFETLNTQREIKETTILNEFTTSQHVNTVKKAANFIGAVVTLVAFGGLIVFVVVELKKRATQRQEYYYSESLLMAASPY